MTYRVNIIIKNLDAYMVNKLNTKLLGILIFSISSMSYSAKPSFILGHLISKQEYRLIDQYNAERKVSPGSLLKPFAAMYLINNVKSFHSKERYYCPGWHKKLYSYQHACWREHGHRWQSLIGGIAHSCNFYFLNNVKKVNLKDYFQWLEKNWSFPLTADKYIPANFIGDKLETKLEIKNIWNMYRKLYYQLIIKKYSPIRKGLENTITSGTLHNFNRKFIKIRLHRTFKLLFGKTGTSIEKYQMKSGVVILLYRDLRTSKLYLLLFADTGNMAGRIASGPLLKYLKYATKK